MKITILTRLATCYLGALLCTVPFLATGCAPQGTQGPAGLNGVTGSTGSNGHNGSDGTTGAVGPTGQAGANAPVVVAVQLCPGTSSYPSVFLEYALCVDGQLYAVYSTNGGFLTQLPPGGYSSDAVGSRCSFTVGDSCVVISQ